MDADIRQVCVVGQGYVGLTLTAVMASSGFDVVGVENNDERLELLKRGVPHFDEPGLEETLQTQQAMDNLRFRRSVEAPTARERSVYIVAVGSPLDENHAPNLEILRTAVTELAGVVDPGDTVIIRSTISVGTAAEMRDLIDDRVDFDARAELYFAHAPERTVQGAALAEIQDLPQVVGGPDETSVERGEAVFSHISDVIVKVDSLAAAEIIKLFDNTYRDLTIAIGNAFGEIAQAHGLDGQRLIKLANAGYDRNDIKQPGAGVGGGCLPKDPYLLVESIDGAGPDSEVVEAARRLVETGREINESMPSVTCRHVAEAIGATGRTDSEVRSLVFGVAFKGQPATNDTRNTPAAPIVDFLSKYGPVDAYDPVVEPHKISELGASPVEPSDDLTSLFDSQAYDLLVVTNDNPAFTEIDLHGVREAMVDPPIVVDGWNVLPAQTMDDLGFHYTVVGGAKRRNGED